MLLARKIYRLVGLNGEPHPVLDTPYDSFDAAQKAAQLWDKQDQSIGIEVKTSNGSWRTILYS